MLGIKMVIACQAHRRGTAVPAHCQRRVLTLADSIGRCRCVRQGGGARIGRYGPAWKYSAAQLGDIAWAQVEGVPELAWGACQRAAPPPPPPPQPQILLAFSISY